ncbi:hypothetical protein [Nonomuraea sp. NPDC048916]|uniref:tetratricopeptide repeat protein n=1 Tax=Nonomuraea sp. NPDC048916 TaxID=3154232 RepID=UPI0034050BA8
MGGEARALYEALRALEHRAKVAQGTGYSRREIERVLKAEPYKVVFDSRRISTWLPQNPDKAQVPRTVDAVWPLVQLWSYWAGDRTPSRRFWSDLVEAAQSNRSPESAASQPPGWPMTKVIDPFTLGVHRAIDVVSPAAEAELPVLPTYVKRAHDEQLHQILKRAVGGQSAIAMLVGGSSTGKTRACWEVIHAFPAGWRLWHPIDLTNPEVFLKELTLVAPRTVIWINESQHYLFTPTSALGERVSVALRELLRDHERAPVLVLGTIWPEYFNTLTTSPAPGAVDPHPHARALLTGMDIPVPTTFTGIDMDTLKAKDHNDARLFHAIRFAEDGHITQYLAGTPALLERYRTAPAIAQALIHAAMDARRLGHSFALTGNFLAHAAPSYLTDQQWSEAGDDWLEQGLAYTAKPCRGARGPLTRIRPRPGAPVPPQPLYRLADYLDQHARGARTFLCPPDGFWAAARYGATTDDLIALARAAQKRWRNRYAAQLYRQAANAHRTDALLALALIHEESGDYTGAEHLYSDVANSGNAAGFWGLAQLSMKMGDHAKAESRIRQAAEVGHGEALLTLARMQEEAGNTFEAERLYRQAADTGNNVALRALARIRKQAGDHVEAERLTQRAARGVQTFRRRSLADIQQRLGGKVEAERRFREYVTAGDSHALSILAEMREDAGDHIEAENLAYQAAEDGSTEALIALIGIRYNAGNQKDAERLAWQAANAGDAEGLKEIARIRGEDPYWRQMLQFGLEADGCVSDPW